MSNGMAYVLDEYGDLPTRMNHELVEMQPVEDPEDIELLRTMIERHYERTGSRRAEELLSGWQDALPKFRKVAPRVVPGQTDAMAEVRHHLEIVREEDGLAEDSMPVQSHNGPKAASFSANG